MKGTFKNMCAQSRPQLAHFFRPFDIVSITHTGVVKGQPHISRDLVCKCIVNRLHAGQFGGVACYVRKWLAPYVTSVLCRREHGIAWLKIAKECGLEKDIYLAIVYLPHQDSSFFDHLPYRSFIDDLECDILNFAARGSVLLSGDFNSRTGGLMRPVSHIEHVNDTDHPIGNDFVARLHRISEDHTVNAWGRELLELCDRHNLFIANGVQELRGSGSHTFQGSAASNGSMRQSVIDYFILPYDLACSLYESGRGELEVIPLGDCPTTHMGLDFDHKPIKFTLPLIHETRGQEDSSASPRITKASWRDELRETYIRYLTNHGNALELLQRIKRPGINVSDSNDALML